MKYIIRDPANGGSSNNESRQKEAEIKIGKFVYDDDKKIYHETPNKTGMRCDAAMPFFPFSRFIASQICKSFRFL